MQASCSPCRRITGIEICLFPIDHRLYTTACCYRTSRDFWPTKSHGVDRGDEY